MRAKIRAASFSFMLGNWRKLIGGVAKEVRGTEFRLPTVRCSKVDAVTGLAFKVAAIALTLADVAVRLPHGDIKFGIIAILGQERDNVQILDLFHIRNQLMTNVTIVLAGKQRARSENVRHHLAGNVKWRAADVIVLARRGTRRE